MRILAVDDDPIILELVTQFMMAVGDHELTTAQSGMEALEILERPGGARFDCFLLDIQMPQMDGIELTRRIKQIDQYCDTPVLMLTAMSEKRYIDRAFAAGATDYVTKPFEVNQLKICLGLAELHAEKRMVNTRKIFAAESLVDQPPKQKIDLFEPLSLYDIENVIDHAAMENYVNQLTRNSLFGSSVFAFSVRRIADFHASLSSFEFSCMISDIAETISDALMGHQFLMSYAGNGIFLCVTESGWQPEMDRLKDTVNLALHRTEIYDNAGTLLEPRIVVGKSIRLVWKSGNALMEALADAHTSAEVASHTAEKEYGSIWLTEQRA